MRYAIRGDDGGDVVLSAGGNRAVDETRALTVRVEDARVGKLLRDGVVPGDRAELPCFMR
jgi:hypothetical protein